MIISDAGMVYLARPRRDFEGGGQLTMQSLVQAGRIPIWLDAKDAVVDGAGAMTLANKGYAGSIFDVAATPAEKPSVGTDGLVFSGAQRMRLANTAEMSGVHLFVAGMRSDSGEVLNPIAGPAANDEPTIYVWTEGRQFNVFQSGAVEGVVRGPLDADYNLQPVIFEVTHVPGIETKVIHQGVEVGAGNPTFSGKPFHVDWLGYTALTTFASFNAYFNGTLYSVVSGHVGLSVAERQAIYDYLASTTPAPQLTAS